MQEILIIYFEENGKKKVGYASPVPGLGMWWNDPRYLVDSKGNAGDLQKTLDRLFKKSVRRPRYRFGDDCRSSKPRSCKGTPYKVVILKLRQEDI